MTASIVTEFVHKYNLVSLYNPCFTPPLGFEGDRKEAEIR